MGAASKGVDASKEVVGENPKSGTEKSKKMIAMANGVMQKVGDVVCETYMEANARKAGLEIGGKGVGKQAFF